MIATSLRRWSVPYRRGLWLRRLGTESWHDSLLERRVTRVLVSEIPQIPALRCGFYSEVYFFCWLGKNRRGSLQDDKLLAKKCRLGFASRIRSEHSDEHSAEQLQEVKHPKARIAHRGICASPDTIFGSHRWGEDVQALGSGGEVSGLLCRFTELAHCLSELRPHATDVTNLCCAKFLRILRS